MSENLSALAAILIRAERRATETAYERCARLAEQLWPNDALGVASAIREMPIEPGVVDPPERPNFPFPSPAEWAELGVGFRPGSITHIERSDGEVRICERPIHPIVEMALEMQAPEHKCDMAGPMVPVDGVYRFSCLKCGKASGL
jgi:hypothetical protein